MVIFVVLVQVKPLNNSITGLVKPTSGKLILNDMDKNNIEHTEISVGIVSRRCNFNLSLLENLNLEPKAKINEIIKLLIRPHII